METAKHKQMFRVIKGNDFSSREEWTRNSDDMSRNCLKHFFQNALAYGEMIVITLNTVCRATVWTLETVSYAKNPQKRKKWFTDKHLIQHKLLWQEEGQFRCVVFYPWWLKDRKLFSWNDKLQSKLVPFDCVLLSLRTLFIMKETKVLNNKTQVQLQIRL